MKNPGRLLLLLGAVSLLLAYWFLVPVKEDRDGAAGLIVVAWSWEWSQEAGIPCKAEYEIENVGLRGVRLAWVEPVPGPPSGLVISRAFLKTEKEGTLRELKVDDGRRVILGGLPLPARSRIRVVVELRVGPGTVLVGLNGDRPPHAQVLVGYRQFGRPKQSTLRVGPL